MALRAYILINLGSKKIKEILAMLRVAEGVKSAEAVTGPYDIVVIAEAEDIDAMGNLVTKNILSIDGIERTLTCIVLHL